MLVGRTDRWPQPKIEDHQRGYAMGQSSPNDEHVEDLVAVTGDVEGTGPPLLRHPADVEPGSGSVQ